MLRSQKTMTSISGDLPRLLLKYALHQGLDPAEICAATRLDLASFQRADARVPFQSFIQLWEAVAARLQDPGLELHFGEALPDLFNGHLLTSLMLNSATVGEALARICRFHGLLIDGAAPQVSDDGERRMYALNALPGQAQNLGDTVLAMLAGTVSRMTEDRIHPLEVWFSHPQPAGVAEYARIFAAPLHFGQPGDRLIFNQQDLRTPNFLSNPAFLAELDGFAERQLAQLGLAGEWTCRVAQTVEDLIFKGEKPALAQAARRLAISPRGLQGRLQAEGTTFQQVVDGVRLQVARTSLRQEGMSLCEVAFLLGFSEQSAFNHAFKRWTGMTPSEFSAGK